MLSFDSILSNMVDDGDDDRVLRLPSVRQHAHQWTQWHLWCYRGAQWSPTGGRRDRRRQLVRPHASVVGGQLCASTTSLCCTWETFKMEDFIRWLRSSALCTPDDSDSGIDHLTEQSNDIITDLLDKMAPLKTVTLRKRAGDHDTMTTAAGKEKEAHRLER